MKKTRLLIFQLFIFSALVVNGQQHQQWAERLNKLESIIDANNKRFELLDLNKELKTIWQSEQDVNEILRYTDKVKVLKSDDEKLSILSFGNSTYSNVYQIEWLVFYNNQAWGFSEEFNINEAVTQETLQYKLISLENELYALSILKGKKKIVDAKDLVTKCMFEELQTLSTDEEKDALNAKLQDRLNLLWSDKELFSESFEQLKRMKTLISDDEKVKVCTYNIQKEGFKQMFYGAVILNESTVKVIPLTDSSEKIKSPERSTLSNKKWYGAIYLDLIQTMSGNKTYYTLLGYKGHDEFIKTRVIDVLTVQNSRLRFGMPIFKTDRITRNRVVFQYSAKATMMLRYDAREKMIVFDNLAPKEPMFRGVYQYYGPDFSYNAFKFTKGVWDLKKEVDLRNPKLQ
ncbi:hypothetical protein J1N10_07120 [Carboxylicivirga sp. A043]|uniref:hypothetical protein n=1 Tax=Carboxylicivirga litoralis TaxID=2816963 RepID=UPI0021CB7D55|nr:hypothetical protein [Carboxylicivirga sp. A043]MCU4155743.1 hypothetical protein [Carboxylicivirga sp. A043]